MPQNYLHINDTKSPILHIDDTKMTFLHKDDTKWRKIIIQINIFLKICCKNIENQSQMGYTLC